ncbi:TetR/AcrR family transcriptional regulator [Pseudobacteroides cellulosolvens]|uniref:Transcriptional regulator, TetR family n=1 Tax=Pseudobacteroides cellulosolvens ATCC 35603 = DSM 2933 TaxID=398512 RepID=A0A0L6JU64_9FIRM|nr:TetR/AcrR family transcriptional regulator [Pseudobacteroides cellulosolvens]KNY29254.1 transcriptional regulator, TetR family [Pseudobacteroides cellulosolvens ATCC 35603 = DSM 2933]
MSSDNILDKIYEKSKLSNKETTKQQKIVEIAIKMFAEKGYANTSTSEIAKAAGVAEGTIFRHYGTKENLLMWVITPFLKDLIPVIAREFIEGIDKDAKSLEEFVRIVIQNRYEFINKNQDIFCIVVKEFLYKDVLIKEFIPYMSNYVLDFIYTTLDKFKASGEIIDLPNPVIIRMILTSVFGYFTMRFLLLKEYNISGKEEEIELLTRFISRGLKAP